MLTKTTMGQSTKTIYLSNCGTCSCNFTATVDATNVICECDGTNNTRTEAYTNPLPNLRVTSVTPTFNCTADGTLSGNVAVVVDKNGCGNAGSVPVQLTGCTLHREGKLWRGTVSIEPGTERDQNGRCGAKFSTGLKI